MEYEGKREAGVIAITVQLRTRDGEERSVTIDGRSSDALFWSLEAIDKFALPFYLTTEGFEKAAEIRREAESQLVRTGMILGPHKKYCLLALPDLDRSDPSPI
jgi:hypothetical protein